MSARTYVSKFKAMHTLPTWQKITKLKRALVAVLYQRERPYLSKGMKRLKYYEKDLQLTIFEPEQSFEDMIWDEFKKEVDTLHKKGFKSLCFEWWRSRFYETIVCPGHSRNKKGFEFEHKANKAWKFIWNRYKKYMTVK